jgi:hypothetical protein
MAAGATVAIFGLRRGSRKRRLGPLPLGLMWLTGLWLLMGCEVLGVPGVGVPRVDETGTADPVA